MDGLKRNRELTETRVIQVSKAKLVSVRVPMMLIKYTLFNLGFTGGTCYHRA
jgi:hypothetical protein